MRLVVLNIGLDEYLIDILIYLHDNDIAEKNILEGLFSIISKLMRGKSLPDSIIQNQQKLEVIFLDYLKNDIGSIDCLTQYIDGKKILHKDVE